MFSFGDNENIDDLKSEPGVGKGLRLVLDAHSHLISSGTVFDNFKGFTTLVGDPNSFPLTRIDGLLLKTGQENYVSIMPTDFTADEGVDGSFFQPLAGNGIRRIEPSKRNCYFSDEKINDHPLQLFRNYSQSNCRLECQIEYVRRNMAKPCTPWYFPGDNVNNQTCSAFIELSLRHYFFFSW